MDPLPVLRVGDPQAPPVLFLHGFMGAAVCWRPIFERLERPVRALAVDLPGHGAATERPARDYTLAGATDTLAVTLDAEGVSGPVAVVGYSMGGRLALHLALSRPERCRTLVLESASPGLRTEAERAARRRTDAVRARRIRENFPAFLEDWYRMPLFASLAQHDLVEETVKRRLQNDPNELGRSLAGMGTGRQESLWPRLRHLEMPATIVTGALDDKYRRLAGEMAEEAEGGLQRAEVEEAGHNVHAERPDRFASLLDEFLEAALQE